MNFYDNSVYFSLNKSITIDEDIELLKSFFQIKFSSIHCDVVIKSRYDKIKNIFEINCLKNTIKQEILKQKKFIFESYELTAFDVNIEDYHDSFFKMKDAIIIENYNQNESLNDLCVLMNYIVPCNTIKAIEYSKIYENNVIYIKFQEKNLDFNEIQRNLAYCPLMKNKNIKIHEAFESDSVMLKLNNGKIIDFLNILNRNDLIKRECDLQIPFDYENSPFIIIKFKNLLTKSFFTMNALHFIAKNYFIEDIVNVNLLNNHLNAINNTINQQKNFDIRLNYTISALQLNNGIILNLIPVISSINGTLNIIPLQQTTATTTTTPKKVLKINEIKMCRYFPYSIQNEKHH